MFRPVIAASLLLLLLGAAIVPLTAGPKQPANVPASVTFADAAGVRSDGFGAYIDGVDCVQAWYASPKGNFFLRTVSSNCVGSTRHVVLDFSNRDWPGPCTPGVPDPLLDRNGDQLDACGITDVPDVRLIADRLFSATAMNLDIPFSLRPDFRNTAWELNFVGSLTVTGTGASRTMTAPPGALAELYKITKTKTLVGRYRMPTSVTVTGP